MSALKTIAFAASVAASGAVAGLDYQVLSDLAAPGFVEKQQDPTGRYLRPITEDRPQIGRYEGSFWAQFRPDALPVLLAGFRASN